MSDSEWLEVFWGDLLSEEAPRIETAWQRLDPHEQPPIRTHLQRMVQEDGWTDGQREAAQAALAVIDVLSPAALDTDPDEPGDCD